MNERDLLVEGLSEAIRQLYTIMPWWAANDKIKPAIMCLTDEEYKKILDSL